MANESILIVEDNPIDARFVRSLLEAYDYVVRTAACGSEMDAVLHEFAPKLILMDIQLPGIDGLRLTRRLKTHPDTQQITVLALTTYATQRDRERALEAGCDGFLSKPINIKPF